MESSSARLLQLRYAVQHYEWGHRGNASLVARLANAHGDDPDPTRRYAELWMGTHPSAPSELVDDSNSNGTRLLLKDWLLRNPDALGPAVAARWEGHLPFLFKVLSVAKALSIQAHPDKKLAEILHALRPETYKDDNHKPEMAIAVTQFRALCGFVGTQAFPKILVGIPVQPHVTRYIPPFDEFEVDFCMVPQGEAVVMSSIPGPSIFLVMAGEGEIQLLVDDDSAAGDNKKHAKEGDVFFVAAYNGVKLSAAAASSSDGGFMHLYRAGVNSKFLASKQTSFK